MKKKTFWLSLIVFGGVLIFEGLNAAAGEFNSGSVRSQVIYTNLNGYLFGLPTNGVSIGFRMINSSNIFGCLLATADADRNQLWIAPPQFSRAEYLLYNSSGHSVAYAENYHPNNKTYRVVAEVPKNKHNIYEGLMGPPFSAPYEEANLFDTFQIDKEGDYQLVAKGRIMRIGGDGKLTIVEFAPVSLSIHFSENDVKKLWQSPNGSP